MQSTLSNETSKLPHSLSLVNRSGLSLSGVTEVVSAEVSALQLKTSAGPMLITGNGLKIKNLNNETHELTVDGEVNEIKYIKGKKSFLKKLFK